MEEAQRAEALRRMQQLQQSDALQKRLQNIQNMLAGQQRRILMLLQAEAAQKNAQQMQAAAQKYMQQVPQAGLALKLSHYALRRHNDVSAFKSPPPAMNPAAMLQRHQVVMQQMKAHFRHQQYVPSGNQPAQVNTAGNRYASLLGAMGRYNAQHVQAQHGRDRFFVNGHHQSRQQAAYHAVHDKLSRHHRKDTTTKQATPTPTAVTPTPTTTTTTSKTASTTTNKATPPAASLQLPGDLPVISQGNTTKLVEVANTVVADAAEKTTTTADPGMSRLGGPAQPKSADSPKANDNSAAPAAKKAESTPDADPKTLKQAGRGLGAYVGRAWLPPETYAKNEVVGINLGKDELTKLKHLNYTVLEQREFDALQFSATRLATPPNFGAPAALSNLHEVLPGEGFALNKLYSTYRITSDVAPSGQVPTPQPGKAMPGDGSSSRAMPCPAERCYAPAVINWQPQLATCAREVKIGVIDTGIDASHPAFVGVSIHKQKESNLPIDSREASYQHGTAVFSLLAGRPGSTTAGLVSGAEFYISNAFYRDQYGHATSSSVAMLGAMNWMLKQNVDVLNLSFAGPPDQLVHDAIKKITNTGTVVLAAVGNDGPQAPPNYPAAYEQVIAVTAVDRNLAVYPHANSGKYVAVAAPGVDVVTALPNKSEGIQSGTSFAVPFAASVVAVSYHPALRTNGDPMAPRMQALAALQKSIKTIGGGRNDVFGAGLVQAPNHCEPRRGPLVAGWGAKVDLAAPAPAVTPVSNKK